MPNTVSNASVSMANAISISNTIAASSTSISSLSSTNAKSFTNRITSPVSSAIQDPVKTVLTKTLSNIATTTVQAQKKIDDLQTTLNSYLDKNSLVAISGNKIVISVTAQHKAQGEAERSAIEAKINSVRNTLNVLTKTIGTLSTITNTINVLLTTLTVMESLIAINPAAKVAFTVFKQAIKVVFLKDMLSTYLSVIAGQLAQSNSTLKDMTSKFMNMQVTLNVQDNANQGNQINPDEALSNVSQTTIGADNSNQNQNYQGINGKSYILTVVKQYDNQLIGRATESVTGLLAAQTAPSFIASTDDLLGELKTIINAQ